MDKALWRITINMDRKFLSKISIIKTEKINYKINVDKTLWRISINMDREFLSNKS